MSGACRLALATVEGETVSRTSESHGSELQGRGATGQRQSRSGSVLGIGMLLIAVLAACSDGQSNSSQPSNSQPTSTSTTTSPDGGTGPSGTSSASRARTACTAEPLLDEVTFEPAGKAPSEYSITSFDGTIIRAHWFPNEAAAGEPRATVLMGPGWSLAGDTAIEGGFVFKSVSIRAMWNAGFNVLTWDPRGFGISTGTAQVNSVDYEAKDTRVLLDWIATRPEAVLDRPGDPRVGMVGMSYGGGIQLITAASDCRVDALVPGLAWNGLRSALYPSELVKIGWSGILLDSAKDGNIEPILSEAYDAGASVGQLSPEQIEWFSARGPGDLVEKIDVPTLFIQGTVDTLFTLAEADKNFQILAGNGVPASMFWFCGGHGTCLSEEGNPDRLGARLIEWLQAYLADTVVAPSSPQFEFVDQLGTSLVSDQYPPAQGEILSATGAGTLELKPEGGSGPATPPEGSGGILDALVLGITPAQAQNAVEVSTAPVAESTLVLGAPSVSLTYSGTSPQGERPTLLFGQLIDPGSGLVLGNQITPIPLNLDGATHQVTLPLEMVAHTLLPGSSVTLQLVANTVAFADTRLGGVVDMAAIRLELPTAVGVRPL